MRVPQPVIKIIDDTREALGSFEMDDLPDEDKKVQEILTMFPTVYIHSWKDAEGYEIYIGESNNIFQRTRQHYDEGSSNKESWQAEMLSAAAKLYIIGHEHFNKSMTLDIENKLIQYMFSVPKVRKVHNLRGNPQNKYYPCKELDSIFSKIWLRLRRYNKELFPAESVITDSAIFKASPLHKLKEDQIAARDLIIKKVDDALQSSERGQLIFVEGETGTGKTVLNSSTFYEIICRAEERGKPIYCNMIVNHSEQITVYEQIAERLGLKEKYGEIVFRPTKFVNTHFPENPVDVAFVDEAHLLWTQGRQSYKGKGHLGDILERAKVTVIMFDENQMLTTEQILEPELLEKYRNMAKAADNYIVLKKQLRMQASPEIIEWIDRFTKERKIAPIPKSDSKYEIRIFDSPEELECEIQKRARKKSTALSRMISTYDWPYIIKDIKKRQKERLVKYRGVSIGDWHRPWNREKEKDFSQKEKKKLKNLAWAEQPQTIGEIGSIYTI